MSLATTHAALPDLPRPATPPAVQETQSLLRTLIDRVGDLADQLRPAPPPEAEVSPSVGRYRRVCTADTNADRVAARPAELVWLHLINVAASTRYVKLYDLLNAPSVGVDRPVITLAVPAGETLTAAIPDGLPFEYGIGLGIVTGLADSDATAPSAGDCVVNLRYR